MLKKHKKRTWASQALFLYEKYDNLRPIELLKQILEKSFLYNIEKI